MSLIKNYGQIGHKDSDSDDEKLQKSFLAYLALFMSIGGLLWGTICIYYNLQLQSLIPYGYVILSIVNMLFFGLTRKFQIVRFFQVFISLALPFMFQWSLGGFYSSGFIMLWAVLSLIASLSFSKSTSAIVWLVLFLTLTIVSVIYDPFFVSIKPSILADQSLSFTAINICTIITFVFFLVAYFVSQQRSAQIELISKQKEIQSINSSLIKAQSRAEQKNNELEKIKKELLEITDRQAKINKKLIESSRIKNV